MKHLTPSSVVVLISLAGCTNEPQDAGAPQTPPDTVGCTADLECDDGDPCTLDSCDVGPNGAECVHEDVTCDDPNFVCDVGTGACVCDEDIDCDDGVFCNGAESCFDGVCLSGEPPCIAAQECDEAEDYCFTPPEAIPAASWLVLAFSDWSSYRAWDIFATAFGVTDDLFATNAQVTEALKNVFGEPNPQALLFQHGTGAQRAIREVWTHPSYDASNLADTPDVGLLRAEPSGPSPGSFEALLLAQDVELSNLQVFDEVSLCGFPGDVTEVSDFPDILAGTIRPRTTCTRGTIRALQPFGPPDPATPDDIFLIQYEVPTSPATSGSAVFDDRGAVIGVHSFTAGGDSHFAIRSDRLRELMSWAESGAVASTVLADVELDVPPCQTSYFSSRWQFGFDLPSGFDQIVSDPVTDPVLFQIDFTKPNQPGAGIETNIAARVWPSGDLLEFHLEFLQFMQEDLSAEIVTDGPFVTGNGVPGFFTVAWRVDEDNRDPSNDFFDYVAHTIGVAGVVEFWGLTRRFSVPGMGAVLEDSALSLCTEWSRAPSSSHAGLQRRDLSRVDGASYKDLLGKAIEHFGSVVPASAEKSEKE